MWVASRSGVRRLKQLIEDMKAEAKHDFKSMHESARATSKRDSTQIISDTAKLDAHFWYDLYHDLLTMSDDSVMDEACDDPRTALLLRLRCLLYAKKYKNTEAIKTLPEAIDAYANLENAHGAVAVPSNYDGSSEAVRNPLSTGTGNSAPDSSDSAGSGSSAASDTSARVPNKSDDLDQNPLGLSQATLSLVQRAAEKRSSGNTEHAVVRSRKQSTTKRPTFTC